MADNKNKIDVLDFDDTDVADSIIKVIGVGGGGGNAVNHMYREGIHEVTFVLCNTDAQALNDSPVPVHLQLGKEGLGAGNRPGRARQAAEDTIEDIKRMLDDGTKMAFITAGMGGGTGTGAAPVIARVSKELGILTVGIVTIPFRFEGAKKIDQALDGVEEMAKHVDALLVINNERLREIYPELSLLNGFRKADDTLSVAAKSIAEIITVHGIVNLDFNDVKTVLKDGGVAIMSTGYGEGEGRVKQAIEDALNSPLLNDNDVYKAKKILLSINFNSDDKDNPGLTMEEMGDVTEFMNHFSADFELKWGLAIDPELDKKVKVTILATGFGIEDVDGMGSHIKKQTQEDAVRLAEEEEKAAERRDRRERFYKDNNNSQYKHRPHIYRFTADELDNEDVILAIENTPTYKRTKQMIKDIKRISTPEQEIEENENKNTEKGVISFV
ncbi:cell division protein FtsZ [Prevotella denticola]|jgi:cell division protein ftsZ|uniref:Cell division protein FtsZ n=3 Tax=Prevotella denticola TaxID=28129 RepID=F0H6Z5_9BACT|nr:cell division protein FtsZ [Prevotella denticola]AEA21346.1 cell division protein FtsZ [Prevotella denticola F0289]AXV49345.1 cell division protein FtsZ [Prevotella denticola]EGC86419.1 cell division protein FtsZ [Prevotella denticola CRIS 18C-A]KGF40973.1 cell division protein FtsZ [Prevotella denticola DNF00960]MBF1387515.1 cell division protein FtsZ [Prevotella denticola]